MRSAWFVLVIGMLIGDDVRDARVGSANERPGITGIAHLFEHMMFKGTPTIGTRDARRDQEIIAEQERVRDEIRAEERKLRAAWRRGEVSDLQKPEAKSARLRELEARFRELVQAQRDILVKNEFDRIYTSQGASGMNAFTHYDMTAYFITVPANKLEQPGFVGSATHPAFPFQRPSVGAQLGSLAAQLRTTSIGALPTGASVVLSCASALASIRCMRWTSTSSNTPACTAVWSACASAGSPNVRFSSTLASNTSVSWGISVANVRR